MISTTIAIFREPTKKVLDKTLADLTSNPGLRDIHFILSDGSIPSITDEVYINKFMASNLNQFYFNGYLTVDIDSKGDSKSLTILMFHKVNTKSYNVDYAVEQKKICSFMIDEVFTREICNNIWHFKDSGDTQNYLNIISRILLLTIWDCERGAFFNGEIEPIILKRKKAKVIPGFIPFVVLDKNINTSLEEF